MKKLFVLLAVATMGLVSCKKKDVSPTQPTPVPTPITKVTKDFGAKELGVMAIYKNGAWVAGDQIDNLPMSGELSYTFDVDSTYHITYGSNQNPSPTNKYEADVVFKADGTFVESNKVQTKTYRMVSEQVSFGGIKYEVLKFVP